MRIQKLIAILFGIMVLLFFAGLFAPRASAKNDEVKLKVFVHYPKNPGKPVNVSNCNATTNDQVNDWLWAGWQMPASGVTYKINYTTKPNNLSDSQVLAAITSAFATWSATDSQQIFNYDGLTLAKTAKYDGINAILWKNITSSAIAITYVWYYPSTGQLAEVDTVFNKRYAWTYTPYTGINDCGGVAGTYDLQNIGTHEFGHWIGLDDLYASADKDLTMYGYGDTQELKKDNLGLGDITGVNSIAP
jgi:hypothetical protein